MLFLNQQRPIGLHALGLAPCHDLDSSPTKSIMSSNIPWRFQDSSEALDLLIVADEDQPR